MTGVKIVTTGVKTKVMTKLLVVITPSHNLSQYSHNCQSNQTLR
jgi:hypothetical protein